jgi:hypothetical protein
MGSTSNSLVWVANHRQHAFLFSAEAIKHTAFLLLEEHKKAVIRICEKLKPKQQTKEELKHCFYSFFGELNQQHGLYPGHKLGFDATEPQITTGIAALLDPTKQGKTGEVRLQAFLYALLEGRSKNVELLASLKEAHSFTVQAEKPVPNSNRRIDLFIGWNPIDSKRFQYGLIIEAKFGHKVTKGQLPTYKNYAKKILANTEKSPFFLLTVTGESARKNPDWQPVQWLTLMSRWERQLKDPDTDFTQFRRFIWKKLGH